MAYVRKTKDEWSVEAFYSSSIGWEEVYASDDYHSAKARIREYRENAPGYKYRLKEHRVPIDK